jgi:hypothetical protein
VRDVRDVRCGLSAGASEWGLFAPVLYLRLSFFNNS